MILDCNKDTGTHCSFETANPSTRNALNYLSPTIIKLIIIKKTKHYKNEIGFKKLSQTNVELFSLPALP